MCPIPPNPLLFTFQLMRAQCSTNILKSIKIDFEPLNLPTIISLFYLKKTGYTHLMSMNFQSLHCFPPLEAPIPFKDFYNQLTITTAFRIAYKLSIQKNEQISNERSTLKGGKGG